MKTSTSLLFLVLMLCVGFKVASQPCLTYTYDNMGNRTARVVAGGCVTNNCDFNMAASASTTSPTPNQSFTLTANCTGNDCNGLNYQWTGNGISLSGSSININAPANNGTYTLHSRLPNRVAATKRPLLVLQ